MQSSSGRMIVDFIDTHFPPQHKIHVPKVVEKIIDLVQSAIPLVPKDFIDVRRIEEIEILRHPYSEAAKAYIRNRFQATKRGTCAICMDDFEVGRNTSRLPCLHVFHGPCIVKWLEIDLHCPLCRYSFKLRELAPWFDA
ncbi:putative transcription factor C2H2 family [Rosa chinensis]|uniref:Putative transcription factor C2H2 family n=2 Tax=Rosa chinensis TaxID=74649 RepID=A0A2P6PMY5_ROSCH|nr:putative transcription factor C2H2 family [Rosa chinensis]